MIELDCRVASLLAVTECAIGRRDLDKQPAVYILANRRNGTLYTGVTSNLVKRIWEHKNDVIDGFSRRYGVHMLVYFELLDTMDAAITREKQIRPAQGQTSCV